MRSVERMTKRLRRGLERHGLPVTISTSAVGIVSGHAFYRDGRVLFEEFGGSGTAARDPYLLMTRADCLRAAVGDSVRFTDPESGDDVTREISAVDPEASSGLWKVRLRNAS